jgi:hypothetical protein
VRWRDWKDGDLRLAQEKVSKTTSKKQAGHGYMSIIPTMWDTEVGGSQSNATPRQETCDPIQKITKAIKVLCLAQSGRVSPSKHQALSINVTTDKKNQLAK